MHQKFSEEDIRKVTKGAGINLIGSSIGKGLFFFTQIFIARALGPEIFGLYALGFATAKISEIIARVGINMGGMRFVSIYKDENPSKLKGTLISSIAVSISSGLVIGLVLWVLSGDISQLIFRKPELKQPLHVFAFGIPFIAGMNVVASLLRGFHIIKYTVYVRDIIQPVTEILLIIMFYYTGFGLPGVIYALIISHFIGLMFGMFYCRKAFSKIKGRNVKAVYGLRDLVAYSIPLLFLGFLQHILAWTDTIMLGLLGTARDVGIYRAASQVPFVMLLFLSSSNAIYAPIAANLYHKREMKRLANIFKTATRWVSYVTVPIFIFLVFSAKEVMIIFGKEYSEAGYIVLIILSFAQLINCLTAGVGLTLSMTGRQGVALMNTVTLVILNVLLNIWLIPQYGIIGAAVASGASLAIVNIVSLVEIYMMYKMIPYSKEMAKIIVPSFLCILPLSLLEMEMVHLVKVLVNISLVVILFSISFYIMKGCEEDRYVIDTFKNASDSR